MKNATGEASNERPHPIEDVSMRCALNDLLNCCIDKEFWSDLNYFANIFNFIYAETEESGHVYVLGKAAEEGLSILIIGYNKVLLWQFLN